MARLGFSMRPAHNEGTGDASRGDAMSRDHWDPLREDDDEARARRRRRRRRRSGRVIPPDERAYRDARRWAGARIGFFAHLVPYATVCTLLFAIGARRPALFTALFWGIGVAFHYFAAIAAPDLRRRLLEREVRRQIATDAPRERRSVSHKHERSLEDLSAQVAHEIRNPLAAAKSLVQQMGEDPGAPDNVAYAKLALEELDRVERSVAHLLRYAREEDPRMVPVRVAEIVDSALEALRDRIASQRVRLVRDVATESVLRADPEQLRRVVINLVGNALDALADGPAQDPTLEVQAGENLAGTACWVRVRDNGPGIHPDAIDRIWSPFFTSKDSGTGLGLAIARKIVDAHGGSIEVASPRGGGAEFTITIPKPNG
jgi:signal transduction histidine kinase